MLPTHTAWSRGGLLSAAYHTVASSSRLGIGGHPSRRGGGGAPGGVSTVTCLLLCLVVVWLVCLGAFVKARGTRHDGGEGGWHAGAGAKVGAVDALEDGPRADVAAKAADVTTPAIAGAKDDDGQGDVDDFVASFRPKGFFGLQTNDIDGNRVRLSSFGSGLTLVVNVASHCGYTEANYKGMGELLKTHGHMLNIVAFPCDQFGHQEPGTHEEIREFVHGRYPSAASGIALMAKCDVNGPDASSVYNFLKASAARHGESDADIEWNFVKFLVGKDGEVIRRYPPSWDAPAIVRDIAAAAAAAR